MKFFVRSAALVLCAATALAPAIGQPIAAASAASPGAASESIVLLKRDTPIQLMALSEVSTAKAVAGTLFKLRVNNAVLIGERVVIPIGTMAYGVVVTASESGGLGKTGQMTTKLLHLQLGDAEIPLEGELSAKGTGAGSAGVAIIFTGVVGLFHRGNNAKIKAGETLVGFIADDVQLDISGPVVKRIASSVTASAVQP